MSVDVAENLPDLPLTKKALEFLNSAFKKDRLAMESLMAKRFLTTAAIADDEHIVVTTDKDDLNWLGALGLINGMLTYCGAERVAAQLNDDTGALEGFAKWEPPKEEDHGDPPASD